MRTRLHQPGAFSILELLTCLVIIAAVLSLLLPVFAHTRTAARRSICMLNTRQITLGMISFAIDDEDGAYTPHQDVGNDSLVYLYKGNYLSSPAVAICPSTSNRLRRGGDPEGNRSLLLQDLDHSARHAHDASGGHSYETFHHLNKGEFPHFTLNVTRLMRLHEDIVQPSEAFIVLDSDNDPGKGGWNDAYYGFNNIPEATHNNHGEAGMNIAFLDGSARFVPARQWIEVDLRGGHLDAASTDMVRAQSLLDPRLEWSLRTDGGPGLRYWLR